jgi:signal transduction histidine kinase
MTFFNTVIKYKLLLILLSVIIAQILITIFTYGVLKDSEDNDIKQLINRRGDTIIIEYDTRLKSVFHIIDRNNQIFQQNGKLVKPDTYANYISFNTIPETIPFQYQRWFPRIIQSERQAYEDFGNQFIQPNFTIRDVVQIFPELIFESAKNRSEYYAFTLSEPPFPGSLGGDLLNSSLANSQDLQLTFSNKDTTMQRSTRLFELDSFTNLAIRISSPVYINGNRTDDNLMGITDFLIVPDRFITNIANIIKIGRENFNMFIYDLSDTIPDSNSLVYVEDSYSNFNSRTFIDNVKKIKNSYNQIYNIGNRDYFIQFSFSETYINEERTFFPEGILIMMIILFSAADIISVIVYSLYKTRLKNRSIDMQYSILYNVNHNTRNPLNSIKGVIEIVLYYLTEKITGKSQLEFNKQDYNSIPNEDIILNSVELKDEVINPLIDAQYSTVMLTNIIYSTDYVNDIILGNTELVKNEVELQQIINYVLSVLAHSISEKNLKLNVNIFNSSYKIIIDKDRLCQILIILVENAFKYTDKGYININVQKDDSNIIFQIIDSGIGLEPQHVKNIFEYRKSKPHVLGSGGLSTYHAKMITNSLKGEIGYYPNEGQGSIFWVKIPIIQNYMNETNV